MVQSVITKESKLLEQARDLQEFFLGSYAEKTIEDAIKAKNSELLQIVVNELGNQRQLIEDAENAHSH
jgi:hypothetical protein